MRITLDVELLETELAKAAEVSKKLSDTKGEVKINICSNKTEIAQRILLALESDNYNSIKEELMQRLYYDEIFMETIELLCGTALFNMKRIEMERSVEPFVEIINALPEKLSEKVKMEVVNRAMIFLSTPRRLDCSRVPLLPYAETLATMTRYELLNIRNILEAIINMIYSEATRSAGMTCLGKLVENNLEVILHCNTELLSSLRSAVSVAQQDDAFIYDVEYIMDALGWSSSNPMLTLARSGFYHTCPILALAYCDKASNGREMIITSSVNSAISIWDCTATQIENISLAHHYAASLDVANKLRFMIIGGVGQQLRIKPAVVLYHEEESTNGWYWCEKKAVEPSNGAFITCVRVVADTAPLQYCVGLHNRNASNVMNLYYDTQLIHSYSDHKDLITAIHAPANHNGSVVITGSRDCSLKVYDLRFHRVAGSISHYGTITAISSNNDYIISGGLDKRVVVEDLRMISDNNNNNNNNNNNSIRNGTINGNKFANCNNDTSDNNFHNHSPKQPIIVRSMDSAVLSLSVNNAMQCAVSTLTGLHYIDFTSTNSETLSTRALCGNATPRYNALAWNADGNYLFCGGDNLTLDVYRRQAT